MRSLGTLALIALVAAATAASVTGPDAAPHASRRVVFISFDSGADWVVDKLIAEGKAPAMAAVARDGAQADGMVSVIPSLTAVAHASLWTGAFPRVHGATDNRMPRTPPAEHTILDARSGYLSDVLRAEPIWETAARHGKRVMVMQATQGYPFLNRYPDLVTQFDVYANELRRSDLAWVSWPRGGTAVLQVGETALTIAPGEHAVTLTGLDRPVPLSAGGPFSEPVRVRVGGRDGLTRIGLLEYLPGDRRARLMHGDVTELVSTDAGARDALLAEAGITFGESGSPHYQSGDFGPPIAEGGNGTAERLLVQTTLANQQYFDGVLRYAARRRWDLLVLYVPNMDVAGHALGGMLDPDTPGHDPALAARIWPYYEQLFKACVDDYVAAMRRLLPDATIVMGSDHGVEGNLRLWYPNTALRDAGLLATTASGQIDLTRTKAAFLYSHGGGVFVNTTRYKGGIVDEDERAAVKAAVRRALLSARDPDTGEPLVRAVFDTDLDGEALGVGGEVAPDLYFDSTPGVAASAAANRTELARAMSRVGLGAHGPFPTRKRLHGIFYAVGPGVRAGARPGLVRQVDPAPTVSHLLGIPPPAQASGRALSLD
jgi:predicted AlkP superfamily phosphohydrolase/phosphomutase